MPGAENTGYLVQLQSPEGDKVYPIISAEMIKDAEGNTYNLSELFQSVSEGKSAIAAAVTDKGVQTAADATFQQIVENIGKINVYTGYWYNVTIVDDTGKPVPNTSVYCSTNGQTYVTNDSGFIESTISTSSSFLVFTWTKTMSAESSTQIDGSLYQTPSITTSSYTGTVYGVINSVANVSTTTAVQSNTAVGSYYVNASAVAGQYITIGTRQYLIAHVDASNVYVALRYWEKDVNFGVNTTYAGSTIANECVIWYNSNVPAAWKTANAFNSILIEGVTAPCFVPTYDQVNGEWSYFNSDTRRLFYETAEEVVDRVSEWFTSSAPNWQYVWGVSSSGYFWRALPDGPEGFRPCLAIKRTLFTS